MIYESSSKQPQWVCYHRPRCSFNGFEVPLGISNKLISWLVLGGLWLQSPPVTCSRECLPPLVTPARPPRLDGRLLFCSWRCSGVKGQRWVSAWKRKSGAREGGSVLTLCLDTLNTVISDTEGLWPNQSLCYWTSAGDYSSQTFDIGRCHMVPAFFCVFPSFHHFRTFFQEFCHGYIFLTLKKKM